MTIYTSPPRPLSQLLRQAAAELSALPTPAMSDAARRALAARASDPATPRHTEHAYWRRSHWFAWSGVLACAVLLVGSALLVLRPVVAPMPLPPALAQDSGFVPVASTERWLRLNAEPAAPAWVVATEISGERLASLGLPYDPGRAAEVMRAELLMHASGEVLAVRVVH